MDAMGRLEVALRNLCVAMTEIGARLRGETALWKLRRKSGGLITDWIGTLRAVRQNFRDVGWNDEKIDKWLSDRGFE